MYKFSIRHLIKKISNIALLSHVIFIFLISFTTFSHAEEVSLPSENNDFRFLKLDTSDGLSQSYAFDIVQDNQGFIWVATEDGLNRYDGYEFKHYRSDNFNKNAIANNYIRNLYIDSRGVLWIGTQDGLSRYIVEQENFENYFHDPENNESLSDNVIWTVYEDNNQQLWVSTNSGIHKFNPQSNTFTRIKVRGLADKLHEIKTIFQDEKNNYWLGTFDKDIFITNEDFSYAVSLEDNNKWDLQIPANGLHTIKIIDGDYWLGTGNGVYVVTPEYHISEHYLLPPIDNHSGSSVVRSIATTNDSHVWIATGNGVRIVNLLSGSIASSINDVNNDLSLSNNFVKSLFKDQNNKIWIGTEKGINIFDPTANFIKDSSQIKNGIDDVVYSFAQIDGVIWFITHDKLFKIEHNSISSFSTPSEIINAELFAIENKLFLIDSKDSLYEINDNLTYTLHSKWSEEYRYSDESAPIVYGSQIWFKNQSKSISSYSPQSKKFSHLQTISKNLVTSFGINKDIIWIAGTDNHIWSYNLNKKQLNKLSHKPLNNFNISETTIVKVNGNWLLLGSDSQGAALINTKSGESEVFNEDNGLKNNFISDVLVGEEGNFWLSTNNGFHLLNLKNQTTQHFKSTFNKGSSEYRQRSALVASNGVMYFGGITGFRYFNSSDLLKNTAQINPPFLSDLLIENKRIEVNKTYHIKGENTFRLTSQIDSLNVLELKYIYSPFSIVFASPTPKVLSNIGYKYRLQGSHENWIDTDQNNRRATYTNLSAGDYVFEVQAYDLYNPENYKSKSLSISILPPWWLSPSAILIYTLISLLVLAYFLQQLRHKRLYHLQIKLSEERLKLSLWGSGDEMWDWNIKKGKIYRSNIWGILEFPQDGKRNVGGGEKSNIHENDMPRIREALNEHFKDDSEHFEATYRVRNKKNEWVWVLDRGKIVERDDNGVPTRMTGTLKDISQIKKADERLKLFAKCIENISDAVVIYDRQFTVVDVNKSFQRITGKTKRQMLGTSIKFNQYPEQFTQNVKRHLLQKGSWHGEIESKRDNGELYQTDLNIDIIRDESGNISHFVGVFSDITIRKETESELRRLANTDTLTGLPNRSYFQANQVRLVNTKIPHALLVFDLDNFKKVNDSMGHEVGDLLLCKVAERIRSIGRAQDTVYRLGGDEFSIIVEGTNDIHTITSIAKKILRTIAEPLKLRNQEIVLFSSIGIVLYPEDGANPPELLKNADTAMYHAKHSGGNKYQFFNDSMNKTAVKRLQIENLIRHGLKEDFFSVFYQPKIDISSGKVAGMEALVRFETPAKGIISPLTFIPVSEETGQIIDIGEVVLRKSCVATKKWVDAGLFEGRVAVNLSAVQFTQPNLVGMISDILKETQLPAKHLELEITEGTVMDSPQEAIDTMLQIRAMGIHLSLDDFGTGYSSLAYLKKFPLNTLKIDKAFVDDIETSEQGRNMVATIVTIAHNLGLDVVAEGVESNQQLSFLAGLRCEQLQGYLYSKPLPEKDFRAYLLSHQITNKSTSFTKL